MEVPANTPNSVSSMTVKDMRQALKAEGSSAVGSKAQLRKRLTAILKAKEELSKTIAGEGSGEEADEEELCSQGESQGEASQDEGDGEPEFTVSDEFTEGTVAIWKGTYGFISVGDATKLRLFCHKDDIDTSDRRGCLRKNMDVRCKVCEYTSGDKVGQKFAQQVQCRDGTKISWFKNCGENDTWQREILEPRTVYEGTVQFFNFRKKYGLIKPSEPIIVGEGDDRVEVSDAAGEKKDCVYVGWHDIITDDTPPGLTKGMKVQFSLYKDDKGLGCFDVALPGGQPIVRQDARNKNWKPDTEERFRGTVKFFKLNAFGFITPNEKQPDGSAFPYNEIMFKERLYLSPSDIQTESSPAFIEQDLEVEFSVDVVDTELHAKNVSLPGGGKIVVDASKLPEAYSKKVTREPITDKVFSGKVVVYRWDKFFGFIEMDDLESADLDDATKKAIEDKKVYFNTRDITSTDRLVGVEKDTLVKFKLYRDEKGVGAETVTDAEGNAICGQNRPVRKRKRPAGRGNKTRKNKKDGRGKGRRQNAQRRSKRTKGKRAQKRRNSWGDRGQNTKKRRSSRESVGWGELSTLRMLADTPTGKSRGFVVWWDKSAGEGCIATEGGRRFKCSMDQIQCEKPCWAFLEKDQIIEFQAGQDRFGHGTCFYVTGPDGTLIRQLTTLKQAKAKKSAVPASAVPPTAGPAAGSRFLSTNDGWGSSGGWAQRGGRSNARW